MRVLVTFAALAVAGIASQLGGKSMLFWLGVLAVGAFAAGWACRYLVSDNNPYVPPGGVYWPTEKARRELHPNEDA